MLLAELSHLLVVLGDLLSEHLLQVHRALRGVRLARGDGSLCSGARQLLKKILNVPMLGVSVAEHAGKLPLAHLIGEKRLARQTGGN